ncbi:PLDc N-terminal domain-containing protein [Corynebacterium sp. 32222D000AT]|uniref:PLDc N-terminal domain-containing protein n=1 Tax=unclassified Corynebacterium TaxID=2624378 RepID=UPI0034CF7DAE
MEIPVTYDALWVGIPLLCIILASIVAIWEKQRGSSTTRIFLWCLAQFVIPLAGFLIWIVFHRFSSKRQT